MAVKKSKLYSQRQYDGPIPDMLIRPQLCLPDDFRCGSLPDDIQVGSLPDDFHSDEVFVGDSPVEIDMRKAAIEAIEPVMQIMALLLVNKLAEENDKDERK